MNYEINEQNLSHFPGYKLDKDKKWMEEDGFDIRIVHSDGLCTKLVSKIRNRMNKIKSDKTTRTSSGMPLRILNIYA